MEPVISALGFELFDLMVSKEKITIFIDLPSPVVSGDALLENDLHAGVPHDSIQIDDCVKVNRHVSDLLESMPEYMERFSLEVSSPGAERPLCSVEDYIRFKGEYASLKLKKQGQRQTCLPGEKRKKKSGKVIVEGVIIDATDETVQVELSGGETKMVRYNDIVSANLKVEPAE